MDAIDPESVDQVFTMIQKEYGRLDLVLHGAGIQVSKALIKKSLSEFQTIIATKVGSLALIYQAAIKRIPDSTVHFHILTSAFSYLGNDGQPDYGAANEAMNRICEAMSSTTTAHWSSLGWLGWAGVGMTRGTEYAVLSVNRGLRAIVNDEGKKIFNDVFIKELNSPVNILLAEGEIGYYKVPGLPSIPEVNALSSLHDQKNVNPIKQVMEWVISADNAPIIKAHVVNGMMTVPAAMTICLCMETALKLHPDMKVASVNDSYFHKFIRIASDSEKTFRFNVTTSYKSDDKIEVKIIVNSDFVHKSGAVLEKDILHAEATVCLVKKLEAFTGSNFAAQNFSDIKLPNAQLISDPFVHEKSPIRLSGDFDVFKKGIMVNEHMRAALYELPDSADRSKHNLNKGGSSNNLAVTKNDSFENFRYLEPSIVLLDAMWRFGGVNHVSTDVIPVYVPFSCAEINFHFDFSDYQNTLLIKELLFQGNNPVAEDKTLHLGDIEVIGQDGKTVLEIKKACCSKFFDMAMNK